MRKRKRGKKFIEIYSRSSRYPSVLYLDCLVKSAEDRKKICVFLKKRLTERACEKKEGKEEVYRNRSILYKE